MAAEEQLPGLIFWHKGARRYEVADKHKVELKLECEVNDEEVWKEVEKKFLGGFRVFTAEDFKGELINALRYENKELEAAKTLLEQEVEKLRREKALIEQRLEQVQKPLADLGKALQRR